MYTLFLDTHSSLITISLIKDDDIFTVEKESVNSHSVILLPLLREMLNEKNITLKDINKIIVINGPGSFTGIRIGLSVAKIIGYSLNIPVIPISSLAAYLVSSNIKEIRMVVIEDNKGFYISVFDEYDKSVVEEKYVEDLSEYIDKYPMIVEVLNIEKIIEFSKNIEPVNIHGLKANYIKKIEVEK